MRAAFWRSLSGQQGGELFHRERPAEQIALGPGTAQFAQDSQLLLGLHALGNGTDAHILRSLDDQTQQALPFVAAAQVIHQALVQLELIEAQTRQSLTNLGHILREAGYDYSDVVKTTVLLQSIGDFAAMNAVYAEFFTSEMPARMCYQVAALPMGALVEIDAVAVK